MKNLIALAFFCQILCGLSSAEPVTVKSLFDESSRVPTVLIPFSVGGEALDSGGVVTEASVETADEESSGADCRIMKDPYYSHIYLAKCTDESVIHLHFTVVSDEKIYRVSFGPIEIKVPEEGLEIVPPEPPAPDPKVLAGKQLFAAYCITCHTKPADKAGRTRNQLLNAVNSVLGMMPLKPILQDADYEKLEAYLKSL